MPRVTEPLILLVDDDPVVLAIGREILGAAGFRVVVAEGVAEAIRNFAAYTPDLAILDVHLQDGSGLDVCRAIRSSGHADVPVLIATGSDNLQDIVSAYDAGATDFLNKPLNWGLLPYRIRYALRNGELLRDLASSKRRMSAVLDAIPDQLLLLDSRGMVVEDIRQAIGTPGAGGMLALAGKALEDIMPVDAAHAIREQLHSVAVSREATAVEFHIDASQQVHETRLVPQPGDKVLAIVRDVTQRHRTEQRIRQLANFDDVTGLPNRALFMRELRRAVRRSRRNSKRVALLYIDLDRFKRINDTLGHSVGDALLKGVGERLSGSVRSHDCIAAATDPTAAANFGRLGGDEFVAMLTELDMKEQASAVASRIGHLLATPFTFEGRQFSVSASIGIAVYPDDSEDVESLVMHADTAMYQAKSAGGNTCRLFDARISSDSRERLELEGDLRAAIEGGTLNLYLQPKHSLHDYRLTGAEALLRWKCPTRGWISPAQFIPLAEETGLIVPLGNWVIDESCRILASLTAPGVSQLGISFNLSGGQVSRSDVVGSILNSIARYGVAAGRLELEITESLLMRDLEEARRMLVQLKDAGLQVALDDFGTGYSSLSYLRQLPIDALKIDRSFVQQSHFCADDAAICAAIIAMAKKLGLRTVAEGIELEEQRSFLESAGCDEGQGFLYGRAMPVAEFSNYAEQCRVETSRLEGSLHHGGHIGLQRAG
jgi:diguanylate cyclase (GGDEF)-like protein